MADSDKNLNIGINLQTTKSGPDAAQEIKKLKVEAADLSKTTKELEANVVKQSKATDQATEATKKGIDAKKGLRDAARGLALQFPVLGRVMNAVLNPVSIAVGGIIASFTLWRMRNEELKRSLGGIEMPDVGEKEIERIDRYAAGWRKVAEEIGRASTNSAQLNESFKNVEKLIGFFDQMGMLKPGQAGSDRATAATLQADALERNARAVLAAAGTPGSPEAEEALRKRMKAAAEAAVVEKAAIEKRIQEANAAATGEGVGAGERLILRRKFEMRYGMNASLDDAMAMENANLARQQYSIDQYSRFEQSAGTRAGRRTAISQANADLARAAQLRDEAGGFRRSSVVDRAGGAFSGLDAAAQGMGQAGANLAALGPAIAAMIQATAAAAAVAMDAKAEAEALKRRLNANSETP